MGISKVGILGGGQLARFLALSLLKRGIEPYTLSGEACSFTKQYELEELIEKSDILLLEQELPVEKIKVLPEDKILTPRKSLEISSNKFLMKTFLQQNHLPVIPEGDEIFKTITGGYDGKGIFNAPPKNKKYIGEKKINFKQEIAIMVIRNRDDDIFVMPATKTVQVNGICRWTYAPVQVLNSFKKIAIQIAKLLDIVGIITVEFFDVGYPLINEFAIRPHNSYHWTLSTAYSQFDHYVNVALTNVIKKNKYYEKVTMKNILGGDTVKTNFNEVEYYFYQKSNKPGRKLGHANIVGKKFEEANIVLNKSIL